MLRSCEPLISVIIPMYNAENVIERCLNSIVSQTYKNLEIIIIDDGSTDKSADICDSYAKNDKRVKVIHKGNAGVSAARNVGLEKATGEYIMFVDADDWIDKKFCETMMQYVVEYNVKLVKSLAFDRDESGKIKNMGADISENLLIDIQREFSFFKPYATGVVWGSLYRSDLIKNIRFETDLYVGEDTLFFAKAVKRADKMVIAKERMYNYVVYTESASHGDINEKKMTNLTAWERVAELFSDNERIFHSAKGMYVQQCVAFLQRMQKKNPNNARYWNICRYGILKNIKSLMREEQLKNKVKGILVFVAPTLVCKMIRVCKKKV